MERAARIGFLAAALALTACASSSAATITEFPITGPGSHQPRFLKTGVDGKLWFTDGAAFPNGGIHAISVSGATQGQPFQGGPSFDLAVVGTNAYWTAPESGLVAKGTQNPGGGGSTTQAGANEYGVGINAANTALFGKTKISPTPGMLDLGFCEHDWTGGPPGCGVITNVPGTDAATSRVTSLQLGPDGNLWGTFYEANQVFHTNPGGQNPLVVQLPAGTHPYRLAPGPDGNVWVAEYGADTIERFTTSGTHTAFKLSPGRGPNDIVTGPDGNLWFPEHDANKIGCLTPAGKASEYPIPTANSVPWGITKAPDANLWFTESNTGKIGRLIPDTPCGADANAVAIASGSDTTAPAFTKKLSMSPSKFRVAPGSTALTARKRKAPAGSKFNYTLSEPATVKIAIQRPSKGRKVGGKCKKKTKSNRKRAKCTLYKTVGTLTRKSAQGAVQNAFTGRLGTKKLKRGAYRAVATATDAAGNASVASNASFKIVR